MSSRELEHIEIRSGVNEKLKGFCTVVVNHGDLIGQLSPDQVRAMALQWLEAAEAAHTDQIVTKVLIEKLDMDFDGAAEFLVMLRNAR